MYAVVTRMPGRRVGAFVPISDAGFDPACDRSRVVRAPLQLLLMLQCPPLGNVAQPSLALEFAEVLCTLPP